MSNQDIIRAWKDEDYRQSLSEAERALLPEHPAGLIELAGAEMDSVRGGLGPVPQVATAPPICHSQTSSLHPNECV
jgi:mersacidin/lichenicidin family type 2 lantibiotic